MRISVLSHRMAECRRNPDPLLFRPQMCSGQTVKRDYTWLLRAAWLELDLHMPRAGKGFLLLHL